jgi:hypothetical protein
MVAGMTSQITLKRLRRPIGDVLRSYKVVIDGNADGEIRRGETKTFDVPPGRHDIHLEIDWAKEPEPRAQPVIRRCGEPHVQRASTQRRLDRARRAPRADR